MVYSRDKSAVDLLDVGGHVMAGYLKEFPLTESEFLLIKVNNLYRYNICTLIYEFFNENILLYFSYNYSLYRYYKHCQH